MYILYLGSMDIILYITYYIWVCITFFFLLCADGEDDTAVDHQMEAVFSHLPEGGGGPVPAVLGVSHQGVEPMGRCVTCLCT